MKANQTFQSNGGRVEAIYDEGIWTITMFNLAGGQVNQLVDRGSPTKEALTSLLGTAGLGDTAQDVVQFVERVSLRAKHGNGY